MRLTDLASPEERKELDDQRWQFFYRHNLSYHVTFLDEAFGEQVFKQLPEFCRRARNERLPMFLRPQAS